MAAVNVYQQATEPAGPQGTIWMKDDGVIVIKQPDTTWKQVGNWLTQNFGLAPLANPAFTGSATLDGVALADQDWVTSKAMALQMIYQQSDEPTNLTPGVIWLNSNGMALIRKLDLTWNVVGAWELENLNHLSIEGGTMLGPILGAHGLAPLADPAFTGTATLNGIDLADKQWTTDQLTSLQETLSALISDQLGGSTGAVTIGNNLALGYGTVNDGGTIPLPVYSDNTRASLSEVAAVSVSLNNIQINDDGHEDGQHLYKIQVDSSLVVTCHAYNAGGRAVDIGGVANYIIICKR